MEINGNLIDLGLEPFSSEEETRSKIKSLLKEKYSLDYADEQIKFEWGGSL